MKQYFFVNGHLAFEEASMRELNVHANALFVLLVLDWRKTDRLALFIFDWTIFPTTQGQKK